MKHWNTLYSNMLRYIVRVYSYKSVCCAYFKIILLIITERPSDTASMWHTSAHNIYSKTFFFCNDSFLSVFYSFHSIIHLTIFVSRCACTRRWALSDVHCDSWMKRKRETREKNWNHFPSTICSERQRALQKSR